MVLICSVGRTQTVLLEQHVDNDTTKENYGPNLKHYLFTAIGFNLVAGKSGAVGMPIEYGNAGEITWGVKYKNR